MIDINELRKLVQAATPGSWEVAYLDKNGQAVIKGEHIEIATCWHHCVGAIEKEMRANAAFIAAANPAAISELLDRLEAAEAEALEQARLNGMGSEREAALMAKLEAAERERDDVAQQLVQAELGKRKLDAECDKLYAKVEAMDEAMESLLIRCDDSDSAMYGTLSTSFVRDTVRIARAALEELK